MKNFFLRMKVRKAKRRTNCAILHLSTTLQSHGISRYTSFLYDGQNGVFLCLVITLLALSFIPEHIYVNTLLLGGRITDDEIVPSSAKLQNSPTSLSSSF